MIDMEKENNTIICDSGPEPAQPVVCCRCSVTIPPDEQTFDCDSCSHSTCLECRFKEEIKCNVCKPQSILTQAENTNGSLNKLYSLYFKRKRINKDHIIDVELSTEEGSVQKQMCTVCKRVFKKSNARYHYMCETGEKPFMCSECGQKFVKKGHFESHLNTHYGVRPFKCTEPKCKASFTQKDKLIRHQKSHNKEIKLMCPLCDKLYTSQDILNHHMIKVHSSTKQYRCDKCPRTYKYSASLRIHQLKHLAKRDYMCEVCGKKYALSAQLKLHKRSHVKYHRRPFKCRCGNRFMSKRDKARHELIHTSCHDFECSLCNTTFGRKDNLERHMKNFHENGPPVKKKKGNPVPVASVAPFNSKPTVQKIEKNVLAKATQKKGKPNTQKQNTKKGATQVKTTNVEKLKIIKNVKPNHINSKECKTTKSNIKKPAKAGTIKLNRESATVDPTLNVSDKESNKNSVIVSTPHNIAQNRPSVIKSIPHLLPYRILPPDKRFLKLSGEMSKGNDHPETQTNSNVNNCLLTQTSITHGRIPNDSEKAIDFTQRTVENPSVPQNVRRRTPKDEALNRCYRIIHHTDTVNEIQVCSDDSESSKGMKGTFEAPSREFDEESNSFKSKPQRFSSTTVSNLLGYVCNKLKQENKTASNVMHSVRCTEPPNNTTDSNIGGPSLPVSVSDRVLDINQEDNFASSCASTGEATYSSSTYTPYYDSEYFRDSINSYESNVENLLPNDLDIGFQYISEQLGNTEVTFSSESRIIRYVAQETRIVRES